MRPLRVSRTGVGATPPIMLNAQIVPFNVGFGVTLNGAATYSVQHTFDDIYNGETPTWFDHPTVVGQTINEDGNYAFPVTAVRLNVTAGAGTATLTVLQGVCN